MKSDKRKHEILKELESAGIKQIEGLTVIELRLGIGYSDRIQYLIDELCEDYDWSITYEFFKTRSYFE